jgi:hypothetical protein
MMKVKIDMSIYITASKFLAYMIFITGSVFSFVFNSSEVFMFCSGIAAGLHGLKSWQTSSIEKTKIKNGNSEIVPPQQEPTKPPVIPPVPEPG